MAEREITTIAIIGAGLMGTGLAAEWAAAGRNVRLLARDAGKADAARERVAAALKTLEEHHLLQDDTATSLGRVTMHTAFEQAIAGADLVQESIPERLDYKRTLFAELDRVCPPETILASNTSGLPITRIAEGLTTAARIIGIHYLNPPHLMPPVEVIPGWETAPEVVEQVRTILLALGKVPLVVRREVPGFLWNRLQFALAREAFWLIENGVATPEEVDLAVQQGLGRRWAAVGPFASLDLGGLDNMEKIATYLFPELSSTDTVPDSLVQKISNGRFGAKSGGGFYNWPPDKVAATIARRDAALLAALRDDRTAHEAANKQA